MRVRRIAWLVVVATLSVSLSACSDSTAAGAAPLSVSFSAATPGSSSQSLGALASAGDIVMTIGGHTLDLQQVQLAVDRVKLDGIRGANCRDDDDEFDDDEDFDNEDDEDDADACEEVRIGPTTVDLPLAGGVVTLDQTAVPEGTIRKVEIRISQVRMRGLFDGQAFDALIPVRLEREIRFSPPLVVTAGSPAEITVNLAVATWLINNNGALIDPRTVATNSTLLSIVRSRILSSFRAFEDHNRDGRDDHGGP
jgi:hypothetical protein